MPNLTRLVFVSFVCVFAANVLAESRVDEVWICKLQEGKEIEDVYEANAQWVAHMNEALDFEVASATVTPIVGDQGQFLFVDSFPDLAAWAKAEAYQKSEAGEAAMEAISEALEAAADCKKNALHNYTPN